MVRRDDVELTDEQLAELGARMRELVQQAELATKERRERAARRLVVRVARVGL